jgi:DNA-binding LacI/PurR family transcriptional regulator
MAKTVTLGMIAERVGVTKSTISDVLRNRVGKVKVSDRTREKIHKAVKELNYEPNVAARSLATGKTNSIGFLLSSSTTLGLANTYFASLMAGVQNSCKQRGYNCVVSSYDMSSLKNFVMPTKVRQRSVDGVVITGHVEDEVIQMIIDNGIPFALIGESTDFPLEGLLSVAQNLKNDWLNAFGYLYNLGHRHIGVGGIIRERGKRAFKKAIEEFKQKHPEDGVKFECYYNAESGMSAFDFAYEQAQGWAERKERPTAVVGHDQWCIGFLAGIKDSKFECPKDVSILSTCDTTLCQWYRPAITAFSLPLYESACEIADILIDTIEKECTWVQANQKASKLWNESELIERDSTSSVSAGS